MDKHLSDKNCDTDVCFWKKHVLIYYIYNSYILCLIILNRNYFGKSTQINTYCSNCKISFSYTLCLVGYKVKNLSVMSQHCCNHMIWNCWLNVDVNKWLDLFKLHNFNEMITEEWKGCHLRIPPFQTKH